MRAVVLLVLSLTICSVSPVFASTNIMDVDEESSLWSLNGSGVVIAVADTGIDLDHSCFRNSSSEVGTPGPEHRKIVILTIQLMIGILKATNNSDTAHILQEF